MIPAMERPRRGELQGKKKKKSHGKKNAHGIKAFARPREALPSGSDPSRRAGAVPTDTAPSASPGKQGRNANAQGVCAPLKTSGLSARRLTCLRFDPLQRGFLSGRKNKNKNENQNQQLQEQQHLHSCCTRRAGKHGEQAGDAGGRQEGSLVRCQRWELRNAKSVPYVKEILESRQHFLPLFIDNKDMEKERGRF